MTTEVPVTADMTTLSTAIVMPYTLTAGRAVGTFLAELSNRRILGSTCQSCSTLRVPAQDFCGDCGGETSDFTQVPETGDLDAWSVTDQGIVALIRLDGTDVPFLHRIIDTDPTSLKVGSRLTAVWADEPTGHVLDLVGFVPADELPRGELLPVSETSEPDPAAALHHAVGVRARLRKLLRHALRRDCRSSAHPRCAMPIVRERARTSASVV